MSHSPSGHGRMSSAAAIAPRASSSSSERERDVEAEAEGAPPALSSAVDTALTSLSPSPSPPSGPAETEETEKPAVPELDIEHQLVTNDPRAWSAARKWTQLAMLSFGALIPTMAANIFFPAIAELQRDLRASQAEIALSISLYILTQGSFPLLWSPLSEIVGRRRCFFVAMTIFSVCTGSAAAVRTIGALIALRILGAAGSSAMLSVSAGSIADMYEPYERGVKVGIYYTAPLLGPAFAPVIGGALTQTGSWRTTFWFMGVMGAVSCLSFVFFRETFRVERSLAWQKARKRAQARADAMPAGQERRSVYARLRAQACAKFKQNKASPTPPAPSAAAQPAFQAPDYLEAAPLRPPPAAASVGRTVSLQYAHHAAVPGLKHARTAPSGPPTLGLTRARSAASVKRVLTSDGTEVKFKPSFSDVSPLNNIKTVLRQPHNLISLIYSGLAFGSQYSLSYTAARTFAGAPYRYPPLLVGLVLLALGIGGIVGSVLGGKLSDRQLAIFSEKHGRTAPPEQRLHSINLPMLLCPLGFVAYAWTAEKHTNIAGPIVSLVVLGFAVFWVYASTLSYIVDSNKGSSSGAVACNSCFRGIVAFVASEVAGRLQDAIGDGALYSAWAVILAIAQLGLVLVAYKGEKWREEDKNAWSWCGRLVPRRTRRGKEEQE